MAVLANEPQAAFAVKRKHCDCARVIYDIQLHQATIRQAQMVTPDVEHAALIHDFGAHRFEIHWSDLTVERTE
jgi:hypothetical protein